MFENLLKLLRGERRWEDPIRQIPFSTAPILEDKYQDLRIILAQPEVMPCLFDNTIEFWAERIGLWGKLKIKYTNTNPNVARWITKGEMLKHLTDDTTFNVFGRWDVEKLGYKAVVFKRDYIDPDGKKHKERIWIDIELKPEIKQGMKFSESLEGTDDVRNAIKHIK